MEEQEEPKTPGEMLAAEIRETQTRITMDEVRTFNELVHTASKSNLLPFRISTNDARTVIALVKLAGKYSMGVPSGLKM